MSQQQLLLFVFSVGVDFCECFFIFFASIKKNRIV